MLSVGVHIEEKEALHVVALHYKNRKPVLKEYFSIPLAPQAEEAARLLELNQALKKVQERYKNQIMRLCFALPQNYVSCFVSSFPFSEKFKILKTLPFEIEENTLFQPDNVFFDGRISSFKSQGASQVISFVTLKENVNNFLFPLKQLKVEPYLLSVEGAALANLLEEWEILREPPATRPAARIYIHLGLRSSLTLFLENGKLQNVSHLNWSYEGILKEMEKKYKLSFREAQTEFKEKAFVLTETKGFAREQVAFSNLIQKHLKPLIKELALHKIFVEAKEKEEKQFEEIFLVGPGAAIRNLSVYLSLKLSLPVHRVNLMESLFPSHTGKPENLIATGIAMEGLKQPPYTGLNLIHSFKSQKSSFLSPKWLTLFLVFLGLLFYSFIRNQEALGLADKTHEVFADMAKKFAFISEGRLSRKRVKDFLEEKGKHAGNKERIKKALLTPGSMSHLKFLTKELRALSKEGSLKINLMEINERKIRIQGLIDKAFSDQLKLKLTNMGEARSLKTLPNQKTGETKGKDAKSSLKEGGSVSETGSLKTADFKEEEKPLSLNASSKKGEPVEKEVTQVPFSYSFILKKTL